MSNIVIVPASTQSLSFRSPRPSGEPREGSREMAWHRCRIAVAKAPFRRPSLRFA